MKGGLNGKIFYKWRFKIIGGFSIVTFDIFDYPKTLPHSPPIPKPQLVIHSDSITSSNWVCHLFALVLYIILPIEITTTCPKMSIPHFFSSAIYFQHPNLAGALRGQAIQVIQVSSLGAPGWPAALQLFHDLLGEVGAEACASDGNCHWGWMVFWAKVDRKPLNFRCFYEARFKVWVRFFFSSSGSASMAIQHFVGTVLGTHGWSCLVLIQHGGAMILSHSHRRSTKDCVDRRTSPETGV